MTRFPREDYAVLSRYAPDRRPVAVDLSDNRNLWGASPAAVEAVRNCRPEDLSHYPYLYADSLREAVAARWDVDPAAVMTGCGSDDVIDFVFRAAAMSRAPMTYVTPTFAMVEPWMRLNGHDPRPVPWSVALDDPETLLEGNPALVYVCRPNNPTGSMAPRDWLDGLVEAVEAQGENGPLLFLDEAYADFTGETLLREAAERARLVVARTMSKSYGLAGMRVGFGVARPDVTGEMEKARGPYKVPRLSEMAAAAAIRDESGWLEQTLADARTSRELLTRELETRGLQPLRSHTNFIFVPVEDGTARTWAEAIREGDVAVRPFPACPEVGDALRITVGPWPLMERLLSAVDAALERGVVAVPEARRSAG